MKNIQLDEREAYILAKAKELGQPGITNNEIDSLFLFDFDTRWHGKLAKARHDLLSRNTPFDKSNAEDRRQGELLEQGTKELRYAFRFEIDGELYIGRAQRDETEFKKIDGKIYDCTELDVSIPNWLSGLEKEEWDELERASLADDHAQKLLNRAKRLAMIQAQYFTKRLEHGKLGSDQGDQAPCPSPVNIVKRICPTRNWLRL